MPMAAVLRVAAMEARLELMSSCQRPTRAKMWEGMCRACGDGGRDLRVTAGGGQAELRQLRLVVGVDQVVGHAGMVGLDGEEFFQDRRRLLAIGEGGVVVRFGGEQRERVEDRGFVIVRIGLVNLLHRVGVGLGASFVIQLLRVAVEGRDGCDVGLLARSGGAVGGFRLVNFVEAVLDDFGVRVIPELMPQAHGHAPVRHGAVGIVDGNLLEFFFGLFVPEGVQQGYAALEGLLHGRGAGDREGDRAQLRGGQVFVVMVVFVFFVVGAGGNREETGKEQKACDSFHKDPTSSEFRWAAGGGQTYLGG